jgi:hypothetical protein
VQIICPIPDMGQFQENLLKACMHKTQAKSNALINRRNKQIAKALGKHMSGH